MSCHEQREWLSNRSLVEFVDYHRHILFPLEFISLASILIIAVSFNFATIFTILRVQALRDKLGNMLIINLCVMDLITSLSSMVPSLIDIFSEGYFLCIDVFCRIHGVLATFGCLGNFATIFLIAVHRFLNVFARDKLNLTRRHIGFMIAGGWAFTLGIVIPPVGKNATSVYTHSTHHCSPTWSCAYFITCMSVIYAVAVPTMIVCYSAIFWKVRSSRKRLMLHKRKGRTDYESSTSKDEHNTTVGKERLEMTIDLRSGHVPRDDSLQPDSGVCLTVVNSSTTDDRQPSEQNSDPCQSVSSIVTAYKVKIKVNRIQDADIRIAFAGSLLVLTTIICWTPYVAVNWCTRTEKPTHAMSVFAMWLAYANSALDPIIYCALNNKLRESILNQVSHLLSFLRRSVRRIN